MRGVTLGLFLVLATRGHGDDLVNRSRVVVLVDQSSGEVSYTQDSCPAGCPIARTDPAWQSGPTTAVDGRVTLPTGVPVLFHVTHSNTALYSFSFEARKVDADEIAILKGFTKALGGYLPEGLARVMDARALLEGAPSPIPSAVEVDLAGIHDLVLGNDGLTRTEAAAVEALEEMSAPGDAHIDGIRDALRKALRGRVALAQGADEGPAAEWRGTLTARPALVKALKDLADHVANPGPASQSVLKAAGRVLDSSGDLLDRAHAVERLVFLALDARGDWWSPPVALTHAHGRDVTLTIAPRRIAAVSRITGASPVEVSVRLAPDWLFRPAVGLSLLASTGSSFPDFAAAKDAAGSFHVVESGRSDERFTYGLCLGLTPRFLDHRETGGWAVWLPELTVNPTSDVKAVAVGAGVSFFRIVKLGVGLLWTRHTVLDGQSVGQALDGEGSLKTRDAYGSAHGYVGLSIIGWPPFGKE